MTEQCIKENSAALVSLKRKKTQHNPIANHAH